MPYSQLLREQYPEINLHAEDLLLLEAYQINYLPDRAAAIEFATLLREYPVVHRFLVARSPLIASFLTKLLDENKPVTDSQQIKAHCQEALWEIADMIMYNKHPELYDRKTRIQWDISEITSITSLDGRTVADIGAGSGRIAFLLAPHAQTVFAIEPSASFRSFMKEKAAKQKVDNLFVMDGTLNSIPLPHDSLDVLITSNAIGWSLEEELKEIERVVRPGGYAFHLLQSDVQQEDPLRERMTSEPWNYHYTQNKHERSVKIKYYKVLQ